MPITPEQRAFVADIVDMLSGFGPVTSRAMFGGFCLFHQGIVFGIIDDGVVYFKVDDTNRPDYQAAGSHLFTYSSKDGKTMEMPYWTVPDDVIEHSPTFCQWAKKAFTVAMNAKLAPKKKSPAKSGAKAPKKAPKKAPSASSDPS